MLQTPTRKTAPASLAPTNTVWRPGPEKTQGPPGVPRVSHLPESGPPLLPQTLRRAPHLSRQSRRVHGEATGHWCQRWPLVDLKQPRPEVASPHWAQGCTRALRQERLDNWLHHPGNPQNSLMFPSYIQQSSGKARGRGDHQLSGPASRGRNPRHSREARRRQARGRAGIKSPGSCGNVFRALLYHTAYKATGLKSCGLHRGIKLLSLYLAAFLKLPRII